jgi:hypothetical protein
MNVFPQSANPPETVNLAELSPLARLLVEQALVMWHELQEVAAKTPKGAVLDQCEEAAIAKSREFIRLALQKTAHEYSAAGKTRNSARWLAQGRAGRTAG